MRETGGLKDTVQPYNKYTGQGNGYVFSNYNAHDFMYAIKKALGNRNNFGLWRQVVHNAMAADYSWRISAKEYIDLYQRLLQK